MIFRSQIMCYVPEYKNSVFCELLGKKLLEQSPNILDYKQKYFLCLSIPKIEIRSFKSKRKKGKN